MALAPGTRLGPYEVVAPLGAGGMGEVYRATDSNLKRSVAIKVLPASLAGDAERLARFRREAEILAALNHPNIAAIYGLEKTPDVIALVMELVEGRTLADRIADGPLPLEDALPIAHQIAEALEAAHDQGIVHRDLKPANVKVRPDGTVKVLDFGLAKAIEQGPGTGDQGSGDVANSPTITTPAMTMRGMILGTAAYMSPEQAKGKPVDRRADIWAFGCVLYEMLTGRRLFEGEDVSDTLASVLRAEPRWNAVPAGTPERVRMLLRRCLERDVAKRLPHIGVARLELSEGSEGTAAVAVGTPSPASGVSWRTHAGWAAVAAAALAGGVALSPREQVGATARPGMRFEVRPPDGQVFPGSNSVPRFAVSPDGSAVVFASTLPGQRDQLYVRRFDELEPQPISGTETPSNVGDAQQQPFFSPDGRFVAFFSGGESALKRVPVAGGQVERLATLTAQNCSGDWHRSVILVACSATKGIQRLPASGGALSAVTSLDGSRGELAHLWPQFLPDGEHFIYLALAESEAAATYVGSLKGDPPIRLVATPAMPRFAPPDRLLFVRDDALMSQAVDMKTFRLFGEPIMLQDSIMRSPNTRVGVSTSANGVVVVASGGSAAGSFEIWARRRGGQAIQPAVLESPVAAVWAKLSPDGRSLAFVRGLKMDVWVRDLARGIVSRVSTSDRLASRLPVWMPDGRRLVYRSEGGTSGRLSLHLRDVAGLEPERLLYENAAGNLLIPEDVSPDGRYLIFRDMGSEKGTALMMLPLERTGEPSVYLRDGFRNQHATFSPDGKWVAYTSDETGRQQVFVRSFPDPAKAKHQVSNEAATYPRWRRDGRELFFIDSMSRVSATSIDLQAGFVAGLPAPLFEFPHPAHFSGDVSSLGAVFDVSPDGQQFVYVAPRAVTAAVTLNVAVNWMADLKP